MKVKISRFTTLVQNDKEYNEQQRIFFKAVLRYDGSYIYRCKNGESIYLFALDQADLIHIGILGILYGPHLSRRTVLSQRKGLLDES